MRPSLPKLRTPLLALLLPVLLVAGLWLGGHPNHLPTFLREAFVANQQTRVVDEAIERISRDYYRPVSSGALSDASISGAVSSLKDRFSHYLSPDEFREFSSPPHFTGIGVSVVPDKRGLLIEHVYDASPARRAGLKAGEVIVAVNGRKLAGVSADAAAELIRGRPGTDVTIGHLGAGLHAPVHTVRITRATVAEPVVASVVRTVRGVKLGVVALATFSPGAHGEVREAVERVRHGGARGIVFDLRGNGGGLVEEAQLIASIFIEKGTVVSTRGRTQPSQTLLALGQAIPETVPMVVLVDSSTASAAEIVTAALQDHRRATVVGTHTFGKGVFQEEEPLSNGGALDITVGEYFTPNGRNLGGGGVKQGAGITPEVTVPKTAVDTPKGLDVALRTLAAKAR
ncbi:MAG TPA: S41 family peptidase [Solirubrobacteraceae bacterium]|nr:S41 family peptidase [Solirubrobacteraceae bacterium]